MHNIELVFRAFLLFLGSYFAQSVIYLNKFIPLGSNTHIGRYIQKMKYIREEFSEIFKKLLFCSFHLLIFCSFSALTLQPHITTPVYTRKKRKKGNIENFIAIDTAQHLDTNLKVIFFIRVSLKDPKTAIFGAVKKTRPYT